MGAGPASGPGDAAHLGPTLGGLLGNTPGGAANPLVRVVLHLLSGSPAKDVPGGLGVLIEELSGGGLGPQVRSWVEPGRNQPVSGKEITDALGEDEMTRLAGETGLTREETAAGIAISLPALVDAVTPEGRLPDQGELDDVVRQLLGETPQVTGEPPPAPAGGEAGAGAGKAGGETAGEQAGEQSGVNAGEAGGDAAGGAPGEAGTDNETGSDSGGEPGSDSGGEPGGESGTGGKSGAGFRDRRRRRR